MLPKPIWAFAVASLLCACSSSPPALVPVDVTGDQVFSHVNLQLIADGQLTKGFPDVSFDSVNVFRAGMYLPPSSSGTVAITVLVDDGAGCIIGRGSEFAYDVASGKTVAPVDVVVHRIACEPIPVDAGADGPPGSTGTGGTGGTFVAGTGGAPVAGCGVLIDDMESGSGRICQGNGRVGHWFTYHDLSSTQTPATTTVPAPSSAITPQPRGSSLRAMHTSGTLVSYLGIGCVLNNVIGQVPKTFDATGYSGIRFWFKGSTATLKVIVQTSATEAVTYGGTCTAISCIGNSTLVVASTASDWTQATVLFSSLVGGTAPFRAADVWSIEFGPALTGPFDFWIDDLAFF